MTEPAPQDLVAEVAGLHKRFGDRAALTDVSLAVRPGEVLGLLGPNGAGKTTLLRVLSGYLPPSAGTVRVAGHDIVRSPEAARACVGYLPEQVPLYRELRVCEYLRYRAELKGVPDRSRAVAQVLAQVGLEAVQTRLIGQLSKGLRQRVGLADAILHRPKLLLLDEPTDGLDPNQRAEALALIAALGRDHAVVLSTHVLPEVERVCQRLVILQKGRIAAAGTPAELGARAGRRIELVCRGDAETLRAALGRVDGVESVAPDTAAAEPEARVFTVTLDEAAAATAAGIAAACEALARAATAHGALRRLAPARSELDAVFRFLTAPPAARDRSTP